MSLIELENITFGYDEDEPPVFRGLSLKVESGTCLVVEGDNGSGKTTLFRILNGLSFPQKGHFCFDGAEITAKYLQDNASSKNFHKRVGYLFQNPDIMLFNGTVYDEIAFGPRQMGYTDTEVDRITGDCLKLFDLESLKGKAPYHLSGGQKKRVALAAVMALNPEVLILDEPCAGLDKKTQDQLIDFLKELRGAGKTLIIATHSSEVKDQLSDEVLKL